MTVDKSPFRQLNNPKVAIICDFNLTNQCKYGNKCSKYHVETTYLWQYLESFNEKNWKNFPNELNKSTEKAFCNPRVKKFSLE